MIYKVLTETPKLSRCRYKTTQNYSKRQTQIPFISVIMTHCMIPVFCIPGRLSRVTMVTHSQNLCLDKQFDIVGNISYTIGRNYCPSRQPTNCVKVTSDLRPHWHMRMTSWKNVYPIRKTSSSGYGLL